MKPKFLVTGGTGFIGSFLVEELVKRKAEVYCLVRRPSLRWIEPLRTKIKIINGDITKPATLKGLSSLKFDAVFHLAGLTKAKRPAQFFEFNSLGTYNLLESVKADKFIYMSTQAAAGPGTRENPRKEDDPPQPVSMYGKSKQAAEEHVLRFSGKFTTVILRPVSVYGPRDVDFYYTFKMIKKGICPVLAPYTPFNIVYVEDVVKAALLAFEKDVRSGSIYFVAGPVTTQKEFMELTARVMKKKPIYIKVPKFLVSTAAFLNEILSKKPHIFNTDKVKELYQPGWVVDTSKALKELGFEYTVELEEGLRRTINWYREVNWL